MELYKICTESFNIRIERLEILYSNTLQCPYSKIILDNRLFITQLETTLPPACMSHFIKGRTVWIYWLSGRDYVIDWVHSADFRRWGSAFFMLENINIMSAVRNFQSESFLVNQPMIRTQFEDQINLQIGRLLNDTCNSFVQKQEFY
ncbi:unnamed protein product [Adineta ricciae]|uniref:Uncharacterized protein n=1 Tax=Adineta ricciae TaxID=249248 RepID=A0A815ZGG9_ADIRI|nr:unnamed protein product [Adineta ricciae]CAF1582944.1 unnamed protein product [Adineta ricciae]